MAPELIHLDRERIKRRGDTRMTGVEQLDEAEWLRAGGTHQLVVARMLGWRTGMGASSWGTGSR